MFDYCLLFIIVILSEAHEIYLKEKVGNIYIYIWYVYLIFYVFCLLEEKELFVGWSPCSLKIP
jgi:hypothetical protein